MKTIAIVFGGFSGERVVSKRSAQVVANWLPAAKYRSFLVDIDKENWFVDHGGSKFTINKNDFSFYLGEEKIQFDGVFNAIHGTPGEDGLIQGYFDLIGIPYNNCGLLASAISFNKAVCNAYLKGFGVNVADSMHVRYGEMVDPEEVVLRLGLPCFVKPSNGGSSIGVTKVRLKEEIASAVKLAQSDGVDALIESFLDGVEVSCGCISQDGKPKALAITEIVPANEFFDFDSKYNNALTQEITPARISEDQYSHIMRMTEHVYRVLDCKGMIRVDYMVCKDGVYLIEPNTTPGLSEASILPQQAKYCGYDLGDFFSHSLDEMFKAVAAKP